jgi:FtsP/CotA-like multicopper oxidase with cupredoxin domain
VNGQVNPVLQGQPGCTQLLRLGNWSPDIWYKVHLDGAKFTVIAEDANPVATVTNHDTLVLPPGKRFDVLVTWNKAGTYRLRTLHYSSGPEGDDYPARVLATFKISGDAVTPVAMPQDMGVLPNELLPTMQKDVIAKHRVVVFSEDNQAGKFFINGQQFHTTAPLFVMKLGTTEEWTLKNITGEEHPFHIHVNDFQVMSVNGEPYDAVGLEDTVRIPAHGQVVIRQRLLDFVGKYVFHCHILAHEDAGMMAAVEVTKDGLPADAATQAEWMQPDMVMNPDQMNGMDMGNMG